MDHYIVNHYLLWIGGWNRNLFLCRINGMKLNLWEGPVMLEPRNQDGDLSISQWIDLPDQAVWGDRTEMDQLVQRLLRFVNPKRPTATLPEVPDEISANLRSELTNQMERYGLTREGIDELEQLVQDFLRPIIYAVIQFRYQIRADLEQPRFQELIDTLHAETAWRQQPPFDLPQGNAGDAIYLLHTLVGPVGYEVVLDGEALGEETNRFVEDRSGQHPAVPFIEALALGLGDRLLEG